MMCCVGVYFNCVILSHISCIKEIGVEFVLDVSLKYCPCNDRGVPKMSLACMLPKSYQ